MALVKVVKELTHFDNDDLAKITQVGIKTFVEFLKLANQPHNHLLLHSMSLSWALNKKDNLQEALQLLNTIPEGQSQTLVEIASGYFDCPPGFILIQNSNDLRIYRNADSDLCINYRGNPNGLKSEPLSLPNFPHLKMSTNKGFYCFGLTLDYPSKPFPEVTFKNLVLNQKDQLEKLKKTQPYLRVDFTVSTNEEFSEVEFSLTISNKLKEATGVIQRCC